jgi:hypothetical protein
MPYLNWKDAQLGLSVQPQPSSSRGGHQEKHLLSVSMTQSSRDELLPWLAEVLKTGASASGGLSPELRIDLPRNWILFWKLREGESRLLIAHPEAEEWVTTAALSPEHGQALLQRLADLQAGASLRLGELASVASVSNVEIVLSLAP